MASKKGYTRHGVRMTKSGPKVVQTKKPKGLLSKVIKVTLGK